MDDRQDVHRFGKLLMGKCYLRVLTTLYHWSGKPGVSFDGRPDWFRAAMMFSALQVLNLLTCLNFYNIAADSDIYPVKGWVIAICILLMGGNLQLAYQRRNRLSDNLRGRGGYSYIIGTIILFLFSIAYLAVVNWP